MLFPGYSFLSLSLLWNLFSAYWLRLFPLCFYGLLTFSCFYFDFLLLSLYICALYWISFLAIFTLIDIFYPVLFSVCSRIFLLSLSALARSDNILLLLLYPFTLLVFNLYVYTYFCSRSLFSFNLSPDCLLHLWLLSCCLSYTCALVFCSSLIYFLLSLFSNIVSSVSSTLYMLSGLSIVKSMCYRQTS